MAFIKPPYPISYGGTAATSAAQALINLGAPASTAVMLLNGTQAMTASLPMGGFTIQNVGTPVNSTDAATKAYVDAVAQGLYPKPSCIVATTTTLPTYTYSNGSNGVGATLTATATGTLTIDGHLTALGDTLLIKNETGGNAPYNGIYTVTTAGASGVAYVLTRSVDMDSSTKYVGAYTYIESGTTNANQQWACTLTSPPTVGSTNITFTLIQGTASVTAGNGLTGTTVFSVLPNGTSLSVSSSGVMISATWAGQSSITTLGTITTGVWNGTALTSSYIPATVAYTTAGNSWTASQVPGTTGAYALGSSSNWWTNLFLGTGSYYAEITTASLTGNVTMTIPTVNSNPVVPMGSATANNVVQYIDSSGVQHLVQLASTNLSDSSALVRNNQTNTYTGTYLQDFSAAGQTMYTAGGGTTVKGTFLSDTAGGRNIGSSSANFGSVYFGTSSYSVQLTAPTLTANRTLTAPDGASYSVIASSAGTNQFATGMSAGVISYAQPSFANLTTTLANKTANYTLASTDVGKTITVTASSSGIAITLPAGTAGYWFVIANKAVSTNTISVTPNGTDKILNSNTSITLNPGDCWTFCWDSAGTPTEWIIE